LLIEVVKELLKSPINRNQRCRKNKSGPDFFGSRCIFYNAVSLPSFDILGWVTGRASGL